MVSVVRRGLAVVLVAAAFTVIAVGIVDHWPGRIRHVVDGCPGLGARAVVETLLG